MENVNDILKRQLLLMKFDSGVTLKENHEKVLGLINEDENLWYSAVGKIKNASNWSNSFSDNWEIQTDDSSKYTVEIDVYEINDLAINISMDKQQLPGYMWFSSFTDAMPTKGGSWNFDGQNFTVVIEGITLIKPTLQEAAYHFAKYFYPKFMNSYSKPSDLSPKQEAANPEPAAGSSVTGGQGWDMGKAFSKYSCLSGSDLAWRDVMNDQYGDVIKINIGKTREGGQIYGRLYLQDGYLNLWDPPYTRIGGENQYAVCRNNKLSFQNGKNTSMTDASTGKPQMESVNKFGKLIKEEIDLEIVNAAGGVGGGGTGGGGGERRGTPRRTVDKSSLVKEVQNKLKELDPTAVVSGTMDQETINKIMLQINKLVEKKNSEAEAKRKEDELLASTKPADFTTSTRGLR